MSKWRPTDKDCIYVIPDIHGSLICLETICDRILPLRKSDGGKDTLVFLGDYIDRHIDSHKVVDFLIELEKKYSSQVIFLMGNHELMLLQSLNVQPGRNLTLQTMTHTFKMWMANGGQATIAGYMQRAGQDEGEGWGSLPRARVADFIPKEHISFFQSLRKSYEIDEYVFVHGGIDPTESPSKQDLEVLVWDRSLLKFVQNAIQSNQELPWEKTVVCGHSVCADKKPVIRSNYMMLDCGSPAQLLVVELRSKKAFMAHPDKNRLVKYELKETVKLPGVFRRVQ